jgi:hypothetical protein
MRLDKEIRLKKVRMYFPLNWCIIGSLTITITCKDLKYRTCTNSTKIQICSTRHVEAVFQVLHTMQKFSYLRSKYRTGTRRFMMGWDIPRTPYRKGKI